MASFGAYLGMRVDFKSAWTELYSREKPQGTQNNGAK